MTYLPYDGTSGWSGSDTSKDRAIDADSSGLTGERQIKILEALSLSGDSGLTWIELQQIIPLHHGTLSGALSVLHKEGVIARLTERRNKCKVYVLPKYINDRETERQGRSKNCPHCGGQL
jgi:DNA-binding HxlR family transcriptional regulator